MPRISRSTRAPRSARSSPTADPNPPAMTCSSTVTKRGMRAARARIRSSSSGFAKRAFTTVASSPSRARISAASSAAATGWPYARIAMPSPSRRVSDTPIGISLSGASSATPEPVPRGQRSGDRDRALVRLQDLADRICEHRRVLRGRRFSGAARRNPVPLHVVVLGGTVAVALLGLDVDEDRAVTEIAGFLEHALYREEVVTVDRPKVREAELLAVDVGEEE